MYPSTAVRVDPASLKFTALKVRLSPLTSRRKHQVVVVSNETTSRDLVDMVVKKARMDRKQAPLIQVVASYSDKQRNGDCSPEELVLHDLDKPLVLYDSVPKGCLQFSLVWKSDEAAEESSDKDTSTVPSRRPGAKMAETAEHLRQDLERSIMRYNGWSLPGLGHRDLASKHHCLVDTGFSKGIHNQDYTEASGEDCIVHYEPHTGQTPDLSPRQDMNRNSLDWSDSNYLGDSSNKLRPLSHKSDSGIMCSNNKRLKPATSVQGSKSQETLHNVHHNLHLRDDLEEYTIPQFDEDTTSPRSDNGMDYYNLGESDSALSDPSRMSGRSSLEDYFLSLNDSQANEFANVTRTSSGSGSHNGSFRIRSNDASPMEVKQRSLGSELTVPADKASKRAANSSSLPNMVDMVGKQLQISEKKSGSTMSLPSECNKILSVQKTRRSLPKIQMSQEVMEQKHAAISEQFSKKLRQFMKKKPAIDKKRKDDMVGNDAPAHSVRPSSEMDETMSVTSLEVADILAGADPMGVSDDEDDDNDEVDNSDSDTQTLDGSEGSDVEAPTPIQKFEATVPEQPVHVVSTKPHVLEHKAQRLSHFVEQSMESFLNNLQLTNTSPRSVNSHQDPRENRFPPSGYNLLEQRPVSVFDLLQTYDLHNVVIDKSDLDLLSAGIVLRDKMVTFQNAMKSSAPQDKFKSCVLPCVAGLSVPRGVDITGVILKGDLAIEVNGRSTFNMAAKHVTAFVDQSPIVEVVIARKRVLLNKATETMALSAVF